MKMLMYYLMPDLLAFCVKCIHFKNKTARNKCFRLDVMIAMFYMYTVGKLLIFENLLNN